MNWLHYLLQVNLYLILFYGFYRICLRNETFHQLNRSYLVVSATLSFFIPVLHADWLRGWFVTQEVSQQLYSYYDPQAVVVTAVQPHTPSFTWGHLCALVYIMGVLVLIGRLTYQVAHLERFLRRTKSRTRPKIAFSFFNFWQVSPGIPNRSTIVAHEKAHVRQLHSADVLLFELITIFNWFNPVVFAYKQSVRNVHEFLADQIAARHEASKADYALLLLSQRLGVQPLELTSNFFDPITLKRRIMMLAKPPSTKRALLKYGFVVPLFVLMIIISSAAVSEHQGIRQLGRVLQAKHRVGLASASDALIDLSKALIISPQLAVQQQVSGPIQGRVLDQNSKPLAGASVIVRNTNLGATTDAEGRFKILLSTDSDLVVSYVGYETKQIKAYAPNGIQEGTLLTISLKPTDTPLSELVVVGYQSSPPSSSATPATQVETPKASGEVFMVVEQQPEFPGGLQELMKYLGRHIRYPAKAVAEGTQGKVMTSFVIDQRGEIHDIKVLQGIGNGCDEEALRVISNMPKWTPGRQNGSAVSVQYTLPVSFLIEKPATAVPAGQEIVFSQVEQIPVFPGGIEALYKYLGENIKYPLDAVLNKRSGNVFVEIVVKADGSIGQAKVLKGIGYGCDEEALRVLTTMPKWQPGKQGGKAVNTRYTLPIRFELN
jgi:TonB family protein